MTLEGRLKDILYLGAEGHTDKEIGLILGISPLTVDAHWKRLRALFKSKSRTKIVSIVLKSDFQKVLDSAQNENKRLKAQLSESNHLANNLKKQNGKLESEIKKINTIVSTTLNDYYELKSINARLNDKLSLIESLLETQYAIAYRNSIKSPLEFVYVNDSCRSFGYEPEEMISNKINFNNIIHTDDLGAIAISKRNTEAHSEKPTTAIYRIKNSEGEIRWVLDSWRRVYDKNEEEEFLNGFIYDITDNIKVICNTINDLHYLLAKK